MKQLEILFVGHEHMCTPSLVLPMSVSENREMALDGFIDDGIDLMREGTMNLGFASGRRGEKGQSMLGYQCGTGAMRWGV